MAHEIDETLGTASAFYACKPAWHGLGVVVPQTVKNAQEACKLAGIDWLVETRPVYGMRKKGGLLYERDCLPTIGLNEALTDSETRLFELADQQEVVRVVDGRSLGVVGGRFKPLQNHEFMEFFQPLMDAGLGGIEACGALRGGQVVWALMNLERKEEILPGDNVASYVLASNGHDGSRSFSVMPTSVRVVCMNTLRMADRQADKAASRISLKHTEMIASKVSDLSKAVAGVNEGFGRGIEKLRKLAGIEMKSADREAFFKVLIPDPPADKNPTRAKNMRGRLEELASVGRGTQISGVRGTMWGALNAVTELVDHGSTRKDQDQRVESSWFGHGANMKQEAFDLAMEVEQHGTEILYQQVSAS